jgi:hypothetical protein
MRRGKSPPSSGPSVLRYPLYGFRIDRDSGLAPVTPPLR